MTQPPGIATPLHRHTNEDEAFLLLDGTMTYRAGDEIYAAGRGRLHLAAPRGAARLPRHRLAPVRFVGFADPGGLFGLYDEVGIPARERRLPGDDGLAMAVEIPRWNEVGPRYGLEVVGPPTARGV